MKSKEKPQYQTSKRERQGEVERDTSNLITVEALPKYDAHSMASIVHIYKVHEQVTDKSF
jgi:hypothetical protein